LQQHTLVLYRLPQFEGSEPSLSKICQLALPPLRGNLQYEYSYFYNGPLERPPSTPWTSAGHQRFPFSNDWTQGIIYTLLSISVENSLDGRYSLVLSREALFAAAEAEAESRANPSTRADVVPWSEWGPRSSRMFAEPLVHTPINCVGQRWIRQDDIDSRMLVVRDFNAFRARRLHSEIAEGLTHVNDNSDVEHERRTIRVGVGPCTSIQSNEQFVEDVVSELPFWEMELGPYTANLCGLMTNGEQLLGFLHRPVVSCVLYYEV
jgi:hypothetical protein